MGTRGCYGFRVDGKDYLSYNHYDSYPSELGAKILVDTINLLAEGGLPEKVRVIRLVDEDHGPTPDNHKEFHAPSDPSVASGTGWYSLLRNLQGDLAGHIKHRIMIEGSSFMKDSLFCEFAYVVNVDDGVLEFYRGFQKQPHGGRYDDGQPDRDGYYAVKLVAAYPLGGLKESDIAGIVTDMNKVASNED